MADKKKKPKGPIRVEAVGPFLILSAIAVAYFTLFFDGHLRRGLEWAGTTVNGAEVNVDDVDVSFRGAGFRIGRIQVTDASKPEFNVFEVGEIRMDFLWDAILRGKFVTEDAGIVGIAANTKRDRPGRVLSPEERKEAAAIRRKVTEEFEKRFESTGLAKIVDLLKGFDPSKEVNAMIGEMQSPKKIAQLQQDLDAKEREWQTMLTSVPGQKEFGDIQGEIDGLQTSGVKSPADAKARLDKAQTLLKRSQTAVSDVKTRSSQLQSDLASFQKQVGQVDDWVAEDKRMLQSKLKLPDLDKEALTGQLFAKPAIAQVTQAKEYAEQARKYIPEKKVKPVEPPGRTRSAGKIYRFPVEKSYPLFWLKRAEISSKVGPADAAGEFRGELTNATTDPQLVGNPTVLTLSGDFPKQAIEGVKLLITADHRQEPARDSFELAVASFPSGEKNFVENETLVFGLVKAIGNIEVAGEMVGEQIRLKAQHTFKQPEFRVAGSSDIMANLVRDAAKSLQELWFRINVQGTLDDLRFGMDSNLGAALARTLSAQLEAQVARARSLIDTRIKQEVGDQQAALKKEFDSQKDALTAEVESRRKAAEAMQAKAERKIAELKKQATGGALDKVKKKLPFGR